MSVAACTSCEEISFGYILQKLHCYNNNDNNNKKIIFPQAGGKYGSLLNSHRGIILIHSKLNRLSIYTVGYNNYTK